MPGRSARFRRRLEDRVAKTAHPSTGTGRSRIVIPPRGASSGYPITPLRYSRRITAMFSMEISLGQTASHSP